MPETDTELAIPAASIAALMDITDGYYDTDDAAEEDVVRVSAPVVAAELRRIADEPGMGFMTGPHDVSSAARLRARADELDPPARQEA